MAFAMHICVTLPPGVCLRVKADGIVCSERVRSVREDALYKSTLPFPFTFRPNHTDTVAISTTDMWYCTPQTVIIV